MGSSVLKPAAIAHAPGWAELLMEEREGGSNPITSILAPAGPACQDLWLFFLFVRCCPWDVPCIQRAIITFWLNYTLTNQIDGHP